MKQCMDADNLHRRLKKIIGQVQTIDRMVDEDVPCEDILAQINTAKSALHGCGKVVLEGHIKHCVRDGIEHGDADKTIENFTKAVERFSNMGWAGDKPSHALVFSRIARKKRSSFVLLLSFCALYNLYPHIYNKPIPPMVQKGVTSVKLAMEKLEKDWIKYPVIHLDLNAKKFDTVDDLIRLVDRQLLVYESQYGSCSKDETIDDRLVTLIRLAAEKTGQRVVILVDEYDKPMLQAIGRDELQEEYRNTLKAFYGVLKSMDGYIKFAMLTGVTKFGKVSVFSDLNNLDDISMRQIYVDLCGISEQELHDNLESELHELADAQGVTYDEICKKLRDYYDGYHFTYNSIGIYNPFSLLNAFKYQEFGSYWFETGTPTYLVELLKKHHYDLHRMAHEETTAEVLNSIDSTSDNPIPVIYQSTRRCNR